MKKFLYLEQKITQSERERVLRGLPWWACVPYPNLTDHMDWGHRIPTRMLRKVSFLNRFNKFSHVCVSWETHRRSFFHRLSNKRSFSPSGDQPRRCPVLPVPTQSHRPAVRRPVMRCPGYVWVSDSISWCQSLQPPYDEQRIFWNMHLSNPKPRHTTGRPGRRGARRGGGAKRGWVERNAVGTIRPGNKPPSCSPANREHCPERLFGSTNSLIRS